MPMDVIPMRYHRPMIRMVGDVVVDFCWCMAYDEQTLMRLVQPLEETGYIAVDDATYHAATRAYRDGTPFGETHPEQRE